MQSVKKVFLTQNHLHCCCLYSLSTATEIVMEWFPHRKSMLTTAVIYEKLNLYLGIETRID